MPTRSTSETPKIRPKTRNSGPLDHLDAQCQRRIIHIKRYRLLLTRTSLMIVVSRTGHIYRLRKRAWIIRSRCQIYG